MFWFGAQDRDRKFRKEKSPLKRAGVKWKHQVEPDFPSEPNKQINFMEESGQKDISSDSTKYSESGGVGLGRKNRRVHRSNAWASIWDGGQITTQYTG